MRIVVIVAVLVLSAALGGCLDAEDDDSLQTGGEGQEGEGPTGGGDETQDDLKGAIRGQVVDEGFAPIAGADVELLQGDELLVDTLSLENGSYAFQGLEPGEYRLKFSDSCCRQMVRGALVKAGETTTVTVQLEKHKPVEGYSVYEPWEGFIGCSAVLPEYGILFNPEGACADSDPNNDPVHKFKLEPGLKTIVVGMEWDEETTNPMGDLRIALTKGPGTAQATRFFVIEGPSPLEIVLGPDDPDGGENLHFDKIDEPWDVEFTVTGSSQGSVVYQQPFTVHYELYYNEPASEEASAIPE